MAEPYEMDMDNEDDRRDALEAGIRSAWAFGMQAERLEVAQRRIADEVIRAGPAAATGFDRASKENFWLPFAVDRHFLFIAGRHLVRALKQLHLDDYLEPDHAKLMRVLRDAFEHWDEKRAPRKGNQGRAFADLVTFAREDGEVDHVFGAGGTMIGGVPLADLRRQADDVHEALHRLQATTWVWHGGDAAEVLKQTD